MVKPNEVGTDKIHSYNSCKIVYIFTIQAIVILFVQTESRADSSYILHISTTDT